MSDIWYISYAVLWAFVLLLALTVLALARQIGLLHRRLPALGARMGNPGPEIGEQLPAFEAHTLDGRLATVGGIHAQHRLLVFVSATCDVCRLLAPALRSIAKSDRDTLHTVIVGIDRDEEEFRQFVQHYKLDQSPLHAIAAPELAKTYAIAGTPYALLVDQQGVLVTKGLVNNLEQMESLLSAADLGFPSIEAVIEAKG